MRYAALGLFAIMLALVVARIALRASTGTDRCPVGMVAIGPRCCAQGQRLEAGQCRGRPQQCPSGFHVVEKPSPGCAYESHRVPFEGGLVRLNPEDWEAQGVVAPYEAQVKPFELDSVEVTLDRWAPCVTAGVCPPLDGPEPGVPVVRVTPQQAETCCSFMGGSLPTHSEWLLAALGSEQRRYPWGATGLVCRRATFGLVRGPCAEGATGPELAGTRPDGATPEGVLDLAGNVAEWVREPDGSYSAWGGSYLSRHASQLKSWAKERHTGPAPYIGFRCAYRRAE